MKILDRNAFVLMEDHEYAEVPLPEMGENAAVRVRSLTGDQRARLFHRQDLNDKGQGFVNTNALCCVMGLVASDGKPLFDDEAKGLIELGKKHPEVLFRIANKIYGLSEMTRAARDEAAKNANRTQTGGSGSTSQEPSTLGTDSTSTNSGETPAALSSKNGLPNIDAGPGEMTGRKLESSPPPQ